MGGSSTSPADFNGKVRFYTRPVEFDYVAWTLEALLLKLRQAALGEASFIPSPDQSELVLEHLRMIEAVRSVEWSISEMYSDPDVPDPDSASQGLRFELERRVALRDRLAPLAEAVLQAQVSAVLADLGVTLAGQPTPPVLYHVTAPPSALIVSPRERIEQLENISVLPDLTLEQITALEEAVAGSISPGRGDVEDLRFLSLPARTQRPDFYRGVRQGPLGQLIASYKAPLTTGFDPLVSPRRVDVLAIHQHFDFRLFDALALGVPNDSGNCQFVNRLRLGG